MGDDEPESFSIDFELNKEFDNVELQPSPRGEEEALVDVERTIVEDLCSALYVRVAHSQDGYEHGHEPGTFGEHKERHSSVKQPQPACPDGTLLPDLGNLLSPSTLASSHPLANQHSIDMPVMSDVSQLQEADGRQPRQSYSEYHDFHKKLVLRDYQVKVAERSLRGQNDIILLPTGAGKTYVAIKIIIEHLYSLRETGKPKVVFFVPTVELAIQQIRKIQDYLPLAWEDRSRLITGDVKMPFEQLVKVITEDRYVVLVVTPAIILNYFCMHKEASLSQFSLFIFDEYHRATKDSPYNALISKYLEIKLQMSHDGKALAQLPQLIGMTATIGTGGAASLASAKDYIIGMCAKFCLESPPIQCKELVEVSQSTPEEEYELVQSRRQDKMSDYLQLELMEKLEQNIVHRLMSEVFQRHDVSFKASFPDNRHLTTYEHYIVKLRDTLTQLHSIEDLRSDVHYCMVALDHLKHYYRTLQLVSLLTCEHGVRHLKEMEQHPMYEGIEEIWKLFQKHFKELQRLAKEEDTAEPNKKIESLQRRLTALFEKDADSKVIIFVQMRVVAQYLAELLQQASPTFQAQAFTSAGPSAEEKGMTPQLRYDVMEGFEGHKYNILVATSVLEEGIDIQACNMVIRYMYVKDMIAKIQSRGRARREKGVMIAMLDENLRQQEEKNHFKERLMYKALDEIAVMPRENFQQRVAEQLRLLTPKKRAAEKKHSNVTHVAKVACKSCGNPLGDMNDVRKYGQNHFLIMDEKLHERVRPFPDPTFMKPMDGMVPYGRLLCKGTTRRTGEECHYKVGNLIKMDTGHFGMWAIKHITVNNNPLKKYKDLYDKYRVEIRAIDLEEMAEIGPEMCFPEELLQEAVEA
ncbi:ATP-dependent RNA helicase DHX58-like isoform X2 [Watersipora subatra]|uniref:ATP-dependent RNA helicase DHX58-like isoform X2 n=1 Tax=Watersipora subatra TaxID=2589382 RepID=UPI00355C2353